MKRFTLSAVAIAAAAALATTACGGPSTGGEGADGDVTLTMTWWGNDDRAQRYEEALALYREENPGVTVQTSFQDFPNYWPARATEAAGRSLPDVMLMDLSYIREFGGNGQLLDLSEVVESGSLSTDDLNEQVLPSGEVDGELFGVPVGQNAFAMFYDANLVATAGVEVPVDPTWDEYNDFLAQVGAAAATTEDGQAVYGSGDYTAIFWIFVHWLGQRGTQAFTPDGQLGFTEADVAEWWGSVEDLRDSGALVPPARAQQLLPLSPFDAGESVTEANWDNFLPGYAGNNPGADLQLVPLPALEAGQPGLFPKPSMLYSIGANTEAPDAAAELVDFLVNDPRVGEIFGLSQGLRASAAQRDAVVLEGEDAQVAEYEDAVAPLLTAAPPPPVEGFGSLESRFLEINGDINYGTTSVEDAAATWFSEAQSTLGR